MTAPAAPTRGCDGALQKPPDAVASPAGSVCTTCAWRCTMPAAVAAVDAPPLALTREAGGTDGPGTTFMVAGGAGNVGLSSRTNTQASPTRQPNAAALQGLIHTGGWWPFPCSTGAAGVRISPYPSQPWRRRAPQRTAGCLVTVPWEVIAKVKPRVRVNVRFRSARKCGCSRCQRAVVAHSLTRPAYVASKHGAVGRAGSGVGDVGLGCDTTGLLQLARRCGMMIGRKAKLDVDVGHATTRAPPHSGLHRAWS